MSKVRSILFIVVAFSLVLAACAPAATPTPEKVVEKVVETQIVEKVVETIITPTPGPVEGTILVDGSSTVAPITMLLPKSFRSNTPRFAFRLASQAPAVASRNSATARQIFQMPPDRSKNLKLSFVRKTGLNTSNCRLPLTAWRSWSTLQTSLPLA